MSSTGIDLTEPAHQPPRSKRGFGCLAALFALAVVVVGLYLVVTKGIEYLDGKFNPPADYAGEGRGSVTVEIVAGDTATDIAATLVDKDVVASLEAFTDAAADDPDSSSIQPGVYKMRKKMSAAAALGLLIGNSNRVEDLVSIPEGLTTEEITTAITRQTDISAQAVRAVLDRPDSIDLPPYARGQQEGYLFPASYPIGPGTTARQLLAMMTDRFAQAAKDIDLVARAEEAGVNPHDVVTVASLIEAEASRPEDLGKVARVIYNREEAGIALQLDSTVHYIAGSKGKVFTTDEQRAIDSPYNTYLYPGLPPGAIGAPGEAALSAALDPTPGRWLYFVTVNPDTGKTLFARTLTGHNANVNKLEDFCLSSDTC
ncbi:MAG: endolytic transglycosylase MltG [Nocardioidaceae bacterium]